MKLKMLVAVLIVCLVPAAVFAQDNPQNKGPKKTVVKIDGKAEQMHSAFVGGDGNSAGGWGGSNGSYLAKETGKPGDHVNGKADANGWISASTTLTADKNSAAVNSHDDSNAKVKSCGNGKLQSNVKANGGGEVAAQSTLGGATAGIYGATTYNAKGQKGANGSDIMSGSTSASQTAATANVSATTKSGGH